MICDNGANGTRLWWRRWRRRCTGVPEQNRGDDEVDAGGMKLLRLGTAVGNPALFGGADDLREEMTLLALVEPRMAASARARVCGSAGTAAPARRRRGQPSRGSRGCDLPLQRSLLPESSARSGASSCIGIGSSVGHACAYGCTMLPRVPVSRTRRPETARA